MLNCYTRAKRGLFWRREASSQSRLVPPKPISCPNPEPPRGAPTRNSYPVCSPSHVLGWTGRSIRAWIDFFFCW
ncbi:hypothetical protein DAI22_12g015000 [Oryza sativa Japonica Group]|nr:hypothetical protein DAI22_12g015000 [Oryza sativa Japonica Group]